MVRREGRGGPPVGMVGGGGTYGRDWRSFFYFLFFSGGINGDVLVCYFQRRFKAALYACIIRICNVNCEWGG